MEMSKQFCTIDFQKHALSSFWICKDLSWLSAGPVVPVIHTNTRRLFATSGLPADRHDEVFEGIFAKNSGWWVMLQHPQSMPLHAHLVSFGIEQNTVQ